MLTQCGCDYLLQLWKKDWVFGSSSHFCEHLPWLTLCCDPFSMFNFVKLFYRICYLLMCFKTLYHKRSKWHGYFLHFSTFIGFQNGWVELVGRWSFHLQTLRWRMAVVFMICDCQNFLYVWQYFVSHSRDSSVQKQDRTTMLFEGSNGGIGCFKRSLKSTFGKDKCLE